MEKHLPKCYGIIKWPTNEIFNNLVYINFIQKISMSNREQSYYCYKYFSNIKKNRRSETPLLRHDQLCTCDGEDQQHGNCNHTHYRTCNNKQANISIRLCRLKIPGKL